jgi:hypothetical protein
MFHHGSLQVRHDIWHLEHKLALARAAQRSRLKPLPRRPSWFARRFAALLARLRWQKAPMPVARRDHRRSCAPPERRCPVCGRGRTSRTGRVAVKLRAWRTVACHGTRSLSALVLAGVALAYLAARGQAQTPALCLTEGYPVEEHCLATPGQAQTPTPAAGAACPPEAATARLQLAPPTAAAPTTVTLTVTPSTLNVKPAASGDPASVHFHYFVDLDPATVIVPGQPIPTGNPRIIHSAATTQDLGPLAPGQHTVWVVLGDVRHVPCQPLVEASVRFAVGGAAPAAVPATGGGGLLGPRAGSMSRVLALLGGGLILVALGGLGWRRAYGRPR